MLRLVPHWFAPDQVPLVTQLTGICGQLGQVLSAVPFLALLAGQGWTTAYVSVVALGVVSIALTLALVKNTPNGTAAEPPTTVRARDAGQRQDRLAATRAPGWASSPTWARSSR